MRSPLGKGGLYLPVVLSAVLLLLPYTVRNLVLAPTALRVAESALSRRLERPVDLTVETFSGSWFWDLSLRGVSFSYGEGSFPVRTASAEEIELTYDPSRLLTADLLAVPESIALRSATVRLNRRATVEEIEEEIEEPTELTRRQIRRFLLRRLPTPALSIDVSVRLPETEEADRFLLRAEGRLEEQLTLDIADGDQMVSVAFSRTEEGIRWRTNDGTTTGDVRFTGEVLAPEEAERGVAGSLSLGADPLSLELTTEGRQLDFSLSLAEGLAEGIEEWSERLEQELLLLPRQLQPGRTELSGRLVLSEDGPDSFLSFALSEGPGFLEVISADFSVSAEAWRYGESPPAALQAAGAWEPDEGRLEVDTLGFEVGRLGALSVEELILDFDRRMPVRSVGEFRLQVADLLRAQALLNAPEIEERTLNRIRDAAGGPLSLEASGSDESIALRFSGQGDSPLVSLELEGPELLSGSIETGSFRVSVPKEVTGTGTISGRILDSGGQLSLDAQVEVQEVTLPGIVPPEAESRWESADARLAVSGDLAQPQIDAELLVRGLRLASRRFTLEGALTQDQKSLVLNQFSLRRDSGLALEAQGRLPLAVGRGGIAIKNLRSGSLELDARVPTLHAFIPSDAQDYVPGGETVVEGRLREESGDLRLRLHISGGRRGEDPSEGTVLGYSDAVLEARFVEEDDDRVTTQVTVGLDGREVVSQRGHIVVPGLSQASPEARADSITLSSEVSLDVPLAVLPGVLSTLVYAEGRLRGSLRSTGRLTSLESEGELQIVNGGARFADAIPPVTALNGRLQVSNQGIEATTLTGELGRAPFQATGRLDTAESRLEAQIEGQNLLLVSEPGVRVRSTVDLGVQGALPNLSVDGSLDVTEAQYTQNVPLIQVDAPPTVDEDAVQLFSVPGSLAATTSLDVAVTAEDTILISNNVYRGTLSMDARLSGNLQVPVVTGRLFADSGTVRLPVTDLRLTNLSFEFPEANPFSPELQARGQTRIRDYDVFVQAYGTVPAIEVQVSSNPPLPQEEAILLLTTGYADIEALGQGRRSVVTAGRFVGRRLSSFLFGPQEAADATALDRLDIAVGRRLSQEGNEVIEVDFRLGSGENWYLEFERDEFDRYNLALAWRFSFR